MLIEMMTQLGLVMTKPELMTPTFILGYLFFHEIVFCEAMLFLFFVMVYNGFLKSIWQIPLPDTLGIEGWAFPSGHMHSAWVFWGWLAFKLRDSVWTFIILIMLTLTGFALIQRGYHTPIDIIGAVGFGTTTLFLTHYFLKCIPNRDASFALGILLSLIAILILLFMNSELTKPHMLQGAAALLGLTLSQKLNSGRSAQPITPRHKIYITLGIISVALFFINAVNWISGLSNIGIQCLCWFVVAFWIGISKYLFKMPYSFHPIFKS